MKQRGPLLVSEFQERANALRTDMLHKEANIPQELHDVWENAIGCRYRALEGRWKDDIQKVNYFILPTSHTMLGDMCWTELKQLCEPQ